MAVLKFKYLKNQLIFLGNSVQYSIPMRQISVEKAGHMVLVPHFNMDYVHEVELMDEDPNLPELEEGMPARFHEELCNDAWSKVRKARAINDEMRGRLSVYVKGGIVQIIEDPYARRTVKLSNLPKGPIEMAAEIDATRAHKAANTPRMKTKQDD